MVRRDLGSWVAATLLFLVLTYAMIIPIAMLTAPLSPRNPNASDFFPRYLFAVGVQSALNVLPMGVMNMLMAGVIGMGVRQARGEYINVSMVFEPFRRFGPNFGAGVLSSVIFYASFAACFFPALFFVPVLLLMPTVAFLKSISAIEALTLTFNTCKRYWLGLLALLFVAGFVAGLGLCACFVGILITYPIYFAVLAIHYRAFFESDSMTVPAQYR